MTIGSGIAVLGVWLAVGAIGWREPAFGATAAVIAVFATFAIAEARH